MCLKLTCTPEDSKESDTTLTGEKKKKKQFQGEPWKSRYGILMSALGIDRILILQRTDNWVSMIH